MTPSLGRRRYVRLRVFAVSVVAVLGLLGCTPEDPGDPPTARPTSATPKPSPTPTMTQDEKDRAAVEHVYRVAFAERIRAITEGGVDEPTRTMRRTMKDQYLAYAVAEARRGVRGKGDARLVGVSVGTGQSSRLPVMACEDLRGFLIYDSDTGSNVTPKGSRLFVQRVEATKDSDGTWRLASISEGKQVSTREWERQQCVTE